MCCAKKYLVQIALSFAILLLQSAYILAVEYDDDNLLVNTTNGLVLGRKAYTIDQNASFYAFQSIPYAEPPIGDLRFEPPVPVKNWDDILNATHDLVPCVQTSGDDVIGSEDCLHLSIYTPQLPGTNNTLLPVMEWIHGGGFTEGYANYTEYNPDYFLLQNVIVVVLHYRLGAFGFLSTEDLYSPGNVGLKDQSLAIKWIKDNIEYFGGDPNRITLFGESAGAASVSYHTMSKLSRGLFQRTIQESGTSLVLWGLTRNPRQVAFTLGTTLLIFTLSSEELVKLLKEVDYVILQQAASLTETTLLLTGNIRDGLPFGPVKEPTYDGAFFDGKSHELLLNGNFEYIPSIIGFNSLEASINITFLIKLYFLRYQFDQDLLIPVDLNLNTSSAENEVADEITSYYFSSAPLIVSAEEDIQFISDDQFVRPIRETVKLQAKYAPIYYYRFSYVGTLGGDYHKEVQGAAHAEELPYLWRSNNIATREDRLVSARMVKLWTNFAKYGDPTPDLNDTVLGNTTWPANLGVYGDDELFYLDIGHSLEVNVNPENETIHFWNGIYKTYGHLPFDTY